MNERLVGAEAAARVDLAREPDFALGAIWVRPSLREIGVEGRTDIIENRVMQVLVALVRAKGHVVSRDDLIESCWDGVIVGDDAINSCIRRLRRLSEAKGDAFSIETVQRVGYRLKTAEARTAPEDLPLPAPALPPALQAPSATTPPVLPSRARSAWIGGTTGIIALSALLASGAAMIAAWQFWPMKPTPATAPVESSVAVLPFVNMSGDPKQEYFSDGFSEELINDLCSSPHLRVVSRTSSFAFKGRNENIAMIARALNVHGIVEGSVREAGNRVRITAQLIDGGNGYHLWSATYDRNLTDILSVQGELARAISAALTHRLLPVSATPRPRIDPAVYRLYLEGIHEWNRTPPENWLKGLATFKQVTARAPGFADGFAWLSRAAVNLAVNDDSAPATNYALATDAAQRALSLDPHNMMALVSRSAVKLFSWDWRGSASDLRLLRNENPNGYFFISGLRNYYADMGFPDEALADWRRLLEIDAQTYNRHFLTPVVFYEAGLPQEELRAAQAILESQPRNAGALLHVCIPLAQTGRIKDARAAAERLRQLQAGDKSPTESQFCDWEIDLAAGDLVNARKLLQIWETQYPDEGLGADDIATHYLRLGDNARAADWFERSYESREYDLFRTFDLKILGARSALEKYRSTAQYKELAEKPYFKIWQAEHDRIAAALAAHRDPLQ
jgi:TolB-like protein/DNA-binding winged helix-turn-helix (wHTH) protein/tetratricopeptide (TPR) repeat protein